MVQKWSVLWYKVSMSKQPKKPECRHLLVSTRVRAFQRKYVDSLWLEAQGLVDNDYWQDGTAENDAKAIRRVARNIARGQWKAAKRNLMHMDTSPRDRIYYVRNLIDMMID